MSQISLAHIDARAQTFAALGDATRLKLVDLLLVEPHQSVSCLSRESSLTRQAVGKHLRVLESSGVVASVKSGRERHYKLAVNTFADVSDYLRAVTNQWDDALKRLQASVER